MTQVTRRRLLGGLSLGAVCSLLSACSSPLGAGPSSNAPADRGTLRVGVLGDIPNLDPHQFTPPVPDVILPIWDRLITFGPHSVPQPSLAESWQLSDGDQALTLTLRRGVLFHSGREFTTQDVQWTLMHLQTDPRIAATGFFTQVQPLTQMDLIDRYTIVLKSAAPWPGIFNLLALSSVLDWETTQGQSPPAQAVGTGPFKFLEWRQGEYVRLAKNERYWQTGLPRVNELYFQEFKDAQAMVAALEAGTLDVAIRPPLVDAVRLQKDPKFHVVVSDVGGTRYALLFNALLPPTDSQQFRQALLYAVDRQRIVDTVLHGLGAPCNLPFAVGSPAYDGARDAFYTFDLGKSSALVRRSAISAPTLDFNYPSASAEWAQIGQIFQADLASIGVTLNLKPTEQLALVASLRARTFNGVMTGIVPLGATTPAQQAVDPYYSPVLSFSGFKSDTLSQLAGDLQHEVDPSRLPQVYARWSDYVLDQAWAGAIATGPPTSATAARVAGLSFTQLELLDYSNVSMTP